MTKPFFFDSPARVFGASIALRAVLLVYGAWQDAHSAIKYTDIDYLVFTDAARFVARGASPYARDTYRYTPLLAWLLLPTTWPVPGFFAFGKVLFALADVLAGWLIAKSLVVAYGLRPARARKYAAVWLLNPMVANISTRGSSEGLLGVLVIALLWATLSRRVTLAGVLLGLAVHFKIYPFIYGASIVWWMDSESSATLTSTPTSKSSSNSSSSSGSSSSSSSNLTTNDFTPRALLTHTRAFLSPARLHLALVALATFSALNTSMYILYGPAFAHHTYLHHLTRIDHRHNFSPYSTLLYLSAAGASPARFETLAFLPQLLLAVVLVPLVLAKKSLPAAMLVQTVAFVAFNKVCTSQYFLWYLVFLPFYLPVASWGVRRAVLAVGVWVVAQALWLQQGYELEFLGLSTFIPGLFLASLAFFAANVWILGMIIADVGVL